jgi:hypothetical protein
MLLQRPTFREPEDASVPFSDPFRPQDHIDQVRKVGRLAQVLLDMRTEYERKPRPELLGQILERIHELSALGDDLRADLATPETTPAGHGD